MAYIPSSSTFCSQDDCSLNESSPPSPRKLWNPDLTTFLAIVQHRQVDFVPRTWQEGLGLVGRGGTAHIGQTHINHEVDFAFKRASQLQQFSQEENAARIYEVFITEILMLTDPGIRGHSNIAKLIGYCWEVTEGNAIYPVIVLEKAKGQNLRQWLESFISSHMSFGDRLEMCIDIASALEAMHHNHIVHGDLKPENILVYQDSDEKVTTRVSDFGYSCFGSTDRDIVYPSYSTIWSAPECHDRGMELQAAKLNDIYAFGLISIYILFMECTGEDGIGLEIMENAVWDFYLKNDLSDRLNLPEWIGVIKHNGRLLDRTLEILADKISEESQRALLERFFRCTLSVRPNQRESSIECLISMLEAVRQSTDCRIETRKESSKLQQEDLPCFHFQVVIPDSPLRDPKVEVDRLIVRREVVHALRKKAFPLEPHVPGTCQNCAPQAAFELAFCYTLGFGAPADPVNSAQLLLISGKDESDLLETLRLTKQATLRIFDEESPLKRYSEEGSLRIPENIVDAVLDPEGSDEEASLLREISEMDGILGDANLLTHVLKMSLVTLYEQQGRFELAESACRMALQTVADVLGDSHATTLECLDHLAHIVRENGKLTEAESFQQSAISLTTKRLGKDHVRTKRLLHSYCDTLDLQNRFQESGPIRKDVFNSLCVSLGATHPEVIIAMDRWASAEKQAGNLKFATTLHHLAFQYAEQDLGLQNSITLMCMVHYADVIRDQQDYVTAEDWHRRAAEGLQIHYGVFHLKTARAQQSLGLTLQMQSKWLDALAMYNKALKTRCRILGVAHIDTITSHEAWQLAFNNQSNLLGDFQRYRNILHTGKRLNGEILDETKYQEAESNINMLVRREKLATAAELYFESLKNRPLFSKDRLQKANFVNKIAQNLRFVTPWPGSLKSSPNSDLPKEPN